MGRRRKTGDTASKSYRKYPTDITLAKKSFFIRIRRWYAMQTSRLRRPDAVKSRRLPKNHDGAPAATATSPLSKRKVFGGRKWGLPVFRKSSQGKLDPVASSGSHTITTLPVTSSGSNNNSGGSNNRLPAPFRKSQSDKKFKLPARTIGEMGNKESVEFITTGGSGPGPGTAAGDPTKPVMRTSLSMEPTSGTNDEEEVDVELPPPMPLVSTATSVGQQHNNSLDNNSATPLANLHSQLGNMKAVPKCHIQLMLVTGESF
ncbi:hypothetical protein DAPPUDRAFT_99435 [Daphnia pulex]|uniref:Uncharacterized protein n=1 Tax=Daphnia pulex TaxID=6669 RepID=E9G6W6_DAPPU|nr:hypothetical protein DAPPUDRAFT_99435 [Daphnia pulex]|eukprot:EFX84743.1 hypothetical protein DAPPUDRAFT_99435 [Daphnia pulex]